MGKTSAQDPHGDLTAFRAGFYSCLTGWGDALFELADAALCAPIPVGSVPSLSLEPEFSRSHGSLYKALARGGIDTERLRSHLVDHRPRDWALVFAVDASVWERCDAECSPE
ncbi:MAG: transposase, partial [Acidimicrobiales bacterium]